MPTEQYLLLSVIIIITIEVTTINQEEVDISSNLLKDIKVEDTALVEAVTSMIVGEAVALTQEDGLITMAIGATVTLEEDIRVTGQEGITQKMIEGIMEAEAGTAVNVLRYINSVIRVDELVVINL